jgi:hypothetical protein
MTWLLRSVELLLWGAVLKSGLTFLLLLGSSPEAGFAWFALVCWATLTVGFRGWRRGTWQTWPP